MVVLSAAVLSKAKVLVARQFVEMTRMRVEGLMSAFIKLIENGGSDHTFIETDTVRYVYLPIESLYLLLITNKRSNIMEDIETLRLLQQVVQDCCQSTVSETLIVENAFNIVFAFDEVISFGYRESVTLSQIKAYTEMESHEEKLQDLIRKSKENEEKDRRKKIAIKLDKERAKKKLEERGTRLGSALGNIAGRGGLVEEITDSMSGVVGMGSSSNGQHVMSEVGVGGVVLPSEPSASVTPGGNNYAGIPKKGMQIGSKKSAPQLMEELRMDASSLPSQPIADDAPGSAGTSPANQAFNPLAEPVAVVIEEKVIALCHAEGSVSKMDVSGNLQCTVLDVTRAATAAFKVNPCSTSNGFKVQVHPNMDKAAYGTGTLELKDPTRNCFEPNVCVHLLKWKFSANQDTDMLPFTVTCWPSTAPDGESTVELELTNPTGYSVQDMVITFGGGLSMVTDIGCEIGDAAMRGDKLEWQVPVLNADCFQGTLSFKSRGSMMPLSIQAESGVNLCGIDVLSCYRQDTQDDLPFSIMKRTTFSVDVAPE
eukprot:GHVN01031187.1.p1 GENE.GHVN01031187.1~~GHVN01031187.1.p1  ORF type:complete len:540 (+),score=97.86 GHVN01031187.1:2-1621(+)